MSHLFFANWPLLAGLVALIVPILIHLLLRRRKERLRFSTLQFFLRQDVRSAQRRKLRNLLLLAARLLLLALVVSAFALPFWNNGSGSGQRPGRCRVFVLDRSASMRAGSRWARAQELLRKAVDALGPDDKAGLVDSGSPPKVRLPLSPPEALRSSLAGLRPGFGASDLAEGLRLAVNLLSAQPVGTACSIDIISDFQEAACDRLAEVNVPWSIKVRLLPVAEQGIDNLALRRLSIRRSRSLDARVNNFSAQDAKGTKLDWIVDGKRVGEQSLRLEGGTTTNLALRLPDLRPGWHALEARLRPGDAFAPDDTRYESLYVPAPIPVLCVEPDPQAPVFRQKTFFVATALAPSTHTGVPFAVAKTTPELLASQLASGVPYALVVLPGLRRASADMAAALRRFVKRGGGLLVFLGEGVGDGRYDEAFGSLLPALLKAPEGEIELNSMVWHLGDYEVDSPVFSAFEHPSSGDLGLPVFRRRFALVPRDTGDVIARFSDGAPFLLERRVGKGRVLLVDTSADTSWTDWPKRKTFLPWIYGLAACATRRSLSMERGERPAVAGAPTELDLGSKYSRQAVRWRESNGRDHSAVSDGRGSITLRPSRPGIYAIRDAKGNLIKSLAVNVPSSESDLRPLSRLQVERMIVRSSKAAAKPSVAGFSGQRRRPLWRLLLTGGLVLLVLESLLANRTFQ